MSITKRCKDALTSYLELQKELFMTTQVLANASQAHIKAKEVLKTKIQEIIKELDSTTPYPPGWVEKVIELEGKTYLIKKYPKSTEDLLEYIKEIKVEK